MKMGQVTRVTANRIAVVFDFDETLTPRDSFAFLLEEYGLDAERFVSERVNPLIEQGWEKYLARTYALIEASRQREEPVTQQKLVEVGKKIPLYNEVGKLFERLQKRIKSVSESIDLEFYLISGGFVDIPRNSAIAKDFKQMWGCEFYYSENGEKVSNGEIEFLKKQMTHTEKTRYLYYLSKGIENAENEKDLIYNYASFPGKDLHVPLDQVIYVGDGASDVPCFDVIEQYGGLSIGIYKEDGSVEEWQNLESIDENQKLSNLMPAGYEEDSELMRSLYLCVECIANRVALRQLREESK